MEKEEKKDYKETSFPLRELFVILIAALAWLLYPALAPPPKDWDRWVLFHFLMMGAILILSLPTVCWSWPFHSRCSISYRVERYYFFGMLRARDLYCGRPSIGKVKVVVFKGGNASWRYFCKYCDPQRPYFLKMLRYRYAEVFERSAVRFRLVEKATEDGDRTKRDYDEDPD